MGAPWRQLTFGNKLNFQRFYKDIHGLAIRCITTLPTLRGWHYYIAIAKNQD